MTIEYLKLEPFGMELRCPEGSEWRTLDSAQLSNLLEEHRVLVIRGIKSLNKFELVAAARQFGSIQPWSFGAINELKVDPSAKNYLFTDHEVPLHWDGAFAGVVPRWLFFQCLEAPETGSGGATCFVDTSRLLRRVEPERRAAWAGQRFHYHSARLAHYGGSFSAELIQHDAKSGEDVLRYAEPVDDLNPVHVTPLTVSEEDGRALMRDLSAALADPAIRLEHRWRDGDILLADNRILLHGRERFAATTPRHLQRVNILDERRRWWHGLRDSMRIRRPEFWLAEIPIFFIPLLLLPGKVIDPASTLFWMSLLLFFLLFHTGDMLNCLADRNLDAVYKTRLSEAVYGLGITSVKWQIVLTMIAAISLSLVLSIQIGRPWLIVLVIAGLLLGIAYSIKPMQLKSRGLWQIIALWILIIVGPMLLLTLIFAASLEVLPLLVIVAAAYGALQEGIILVNTAEDYHEDREAGIRTPAVAWGPQSCIALAAALILFGGAVLLIVLYFAWQPLYTVEAWTAGMLLFVTCWLWVAYRVGQLWRRIRQLDLTSAVAAIKHAARWMPLWITATAWATFAVALAWYLSV